MPIKLLHQQHPFIDYTIDCSIGLNSTWIGSFETPPGSRYFHMVIWDIREFAWIVFNSHIFRLEATLSRISLNWVSKPVIRVLQTLSYKLLRARVLLMKHDVIQGLYSFCFGELSPDKTRRERGVWMYIWRYCKTCYICFLSELYPNLHSQQGSKI